MAAKKRGPPMHDSYTREQRILTSKLLSQNLLRDPRLIETLLDRSGLTAQDFVLEIGAGKGILTRALAARCQHVIAVERDPDLFFHLEQACSDVPNVELIAGNILDLDLPAYPYKVFANIPFSLTTAIVNKLTHGHRPPRAAHLVMQTEAAERFLGTPRETLYALGLKPWFQVSVAHYFERRDFIPAPAVDSVLVRIEQREKPILQSAVQALYRDFVVYCFVHGRPSLYATLERLVGTNAMDRLARTLCISHSVTPAMLEFPVWLCLFNEFIQHGSTAARHTIYKSEHKLVLEQSRLPKEYHILNHHRR